MEKIFAIMLLTGTFMTTAEVFAASKNRNINNNKSRENRIGSFDRPGRQERPGNFDRPDRGERPEKDDATPDRPVGDATPDKPVGDATPDKPVGDATPGRSTPGNDQKDGIFRRFYLKMFG